MLKLYDPIEVTLIHEGNLTRPDPPMDDYPDAVDRLRFHLGVSIAYLIDRVGPVQLPKIQIGYVDESYINEPYVVLINDHGKYQSYNSAWSYITTIFEGMTAVYDIPDADFKADLPVFMGYKYDSLEAFMGKATVVKHEKTTEIVLRLAVDCPEDLFNGLFALGFAAYVPVKE